MTSSQHGTFAIGGNLTVDRIGFGAMRLARNGMDSAARLAAGRPWQVFRWRQGQAHRGHGGRAGRRPVCPGPETSPGRQRPGRCWTA